MREREHIRLRDETIGPAEMLSAASLASQYVELRMWIALCVHGRSLGPMSATTAAVRFTTFSFRRLRSTCFSTVRTLAFEMTLILSPMAMGKRRRHAKRASRWVATQDLPRSAAHPFYARLNQILDEHDFDGYVEGLCQRFYADDGRPGLPPGRYFRLLLIGCFEGLDAERAIAWCAADSFALREFLGVVLPEAPSDHSTISRTRRLICMRSHRLPIRMATYFTETGECGQSVCRRLVRMPSSGALRRQEALPPAPSPAWNTRS
jgi:hypothetical protein